MKSLARHSATRCPPNGFSDLWMFDAAFGTPVCGIDEVGRGPLAGPVVAACAYIPAEHAAHPVWQHVTDSKKLSAKKREELFPVITGLCVYGIAEMSPREIDLLNIHHATLKAMQQAMMKIAAPEFKLALVDGKFPPSLPCAVKTVIKGDSKSLSIAAASIIAKVYRDKLMACLHTDFPAYGWDKNAGYGTATHIAAIQKWGITPHHRLSFAPCKG